jgi:hypothetical protein
VKDKEIISKGPKRRDPACLQTQHDIIIPAGTILRQDPGKDGTFTCATAHGNFVVIDKTARDHPECFKRVIA